MTSSNVQRNRSYDNYRHSVVFRCRIGVHSLGPQNDDMSENHLTLYLLIGNNQSVRVDMLPSINGDHRDFCGRLELRGHDYTLSNGVIEHSDVDAVGCPDTFDAGGEMTATSEARTVKQFVELLEEAGLTSYRFTNLNGKALGCRNWLHTAMQLFASRGYLAPDVDLSQDEGNRPSVQRLVAQQWDRSKPARNLQIVPGLFLSRTPAAVDTSRLIALLQATNLRVLRVLAAALAATYEDVMERYDEAASTRRSTRNSGLRALASYAGRRSWRPSLAQDFSRARLQHMDRLSLSVQSRYTRAHLWMQSAKSLRSSDEAQTHGGSIYTLYLAAVWEMSGPPDEDSGLESDSD